MAAVRNKKCHQSGSFTILHLVTSTILASIVISSLPRLHAGTVKMQRYFTANSQMQDVRLALLDTLDCRATLSAPGNSCSSGKIDIYNRNGRVSIGRNAPFKVGPYVISAECNGTSVDFFVTKAGAPKDGAKKLTLFCR